MAVAVQDIAGASRIPVAGGPAGGVGPLHLCVKDVTFDSTYPTGGEALTAADLGLGTVLFAWVQSTSGYVLSYDYTNSKLLAYRGDNTNAASAPLVEVANNVNLSAVTVRVVALGTPA